jgi:hypothetical protein
MNNTEIKPLPTTKRELLTALLEDRKFLTLGGHTLYYDDSAPCYPFKQSLNPTKNPSSYASLGSWTPKDLLDLKEVLPPKWYENIPSDGVLCEVWDEDTDTKVTTLIHKYSSKQTYPFQTSNYSYYLNATPLSKERMDVLTNNTLEALLCDS